MAQVLPSLLSADFARLGEEVAAVERGGATMLHVDVMDGHFVPNLTLGPPVVKSLRRVTKSVLDVHLMITDPDTYAPIFVDAGADQVSVHYEAATHLDRTIRHIRSLGAKAGVVINPATTVAVLDDILEVVDYVLVMSVNPGFGGQEFIPNALKKVAKLAQARRERGLPFKIEIDGGVSRKNVEAIVQAGCDWLVAGSSVFGSGDPESAVKELQHLAAGALAVRV